MTGDGLLELRRRTTLVRAAAPAVAPNDNGWRCTVVAPLQSVAKGGEPTLAGDAEGPDLLQRVPRIGSKKQPSKDHSSSTTE